MKRILPFLLFLIHFSCSAGDTLQHKYHYWGSAGIIAGGASGLISAGKQFGLNISISQRHFLHASYSKIQCFGFPFVSPKSGLERLEYLTLLYGRGHYASNDLMVRAATGIIAGKGVFRRQLPGSYQYNYSKFEYIGVPLRLGFVYGSPWLGLGADFFINIQKEFEAGVVISFNAGWIRDK